MAPIMSLLSSRIGTSAIAPSLLRELGVQLGELGRRGLDVRFVTGAYGCPLPSDLPYLRLRGAPPRRGLLAWLALLVSGEEVERAALERALPAGAAMVKILDELGLVREAAGDGRLALRGCLQPLGRRESGGGPWLLTDPLGAGGDAVSAPDLSAWNVLGALPRAPQLAGRAAIDVGAGAGAIALTLASRGARVVATDLHAPALALCAWNAELAGHAGHAIETRVADVWQGVPEARFSLVVFNAPLLRAPTLGGDEATWYTSSAQGEAVALRFVEGLDRYLDHDGEALLHSQWTPSLAEALARFRVTSLRFASAADGTPFGLHRIERGSPRLRVLQTPLGRALPCLHRAIFEHTEPGDGVAVTPAPWLERVERRVLATGARPEVAFGGVPIDAATDACLADFAAAPRPIDTDDERALVERGWLVDARCGVPPAGGLE